MGKKKEKYEAPKSLSLSGVAQGACTRGSNFVTVKCTLGINAGENCQAGTTADLNCLNGTTNITGNCNAGGTPRK